MVVKSYNVTSHQFVLYRTSENGLIARGKENVFFYERFQRRNWSENYKGLRLNIKKKWKFQCDFYMIGWFIRFFIRRCLTRWKREIEAALFNTRFVPCFRESVETCLLFIVVYCAIEFINFIETVDVIFKLDFNFNLIFSRSEINNRILMNASRL